MPWGVILKNMFEEIVSDKNIEAAFIDLVAKFAQDSKDFRYHGLDNLRSLDYEVDSKELLSAVKQELLDKTPVEPALLLRIPKKNNPAKNREVFIYNIKERIKAEAIYRVVLPVFEAHFSDRLYSYRPNKPPYLASGLFARRYRRCVNRDTVAIFDLTNYSSLIQQDMLVKQLEALGFDEKVMDLFKLFIFNRVYDRGEIKQLPVGIVQGVPLIALFANLYLTDIDFKYQKQVAFYVRVGDDLALCDYNTSKLEKLAHQLHQELVERGLSVNKGKLFVGPATQAFAFLGYSFENTRIRLQASFVKRAVTEWQELLLYKNEPLRKKILLLTRIINAPNASFNAQFMKIVRDKSQVNDSQQIAKLSEEFFRILTKLFYGRVTPRNRRLVSEIIEKFNIISLYSFYNRFHYGRDDKEKK